MSILLGILTFILILISLFLILVVLAQKTKDSGVGAALGGGAAEAAFGAETGNVLTRMTKYSAVLFFVLAFALYLGRIYERNHAQAEAGNALPEIESTTALPPLPAPATPGADVPASTSTPAVTVPSTAPATDAASATTAPAAPETTPAEAPKTP